MTFKTRIEFFNTLTNTHIKLKQIEGVELKTKEITKFIGEKKKYTQPAGLIVTLIFISFIVINHHQNMSHEAEPATPQTGTKAIGVLIDGASSVTAGKCTPYKITTVDAVRNPVNGTGVRIMFNHSGGTPAYIFPNAACTDLNTALYYGEIKPGEKEASYSVLFSSAGKAHVSATRSLDKSILKVFNGFEIVVDPDLTSMRLFFSGIPSVVEVNTPPDILVYIHDKYDNRITDSVDGKVTLSLEINGKALPLAETRVIDGVAKFQNLDLRKVQASEITFVAQLKDITAKSSPLRTSIVSDVVQQAHSIQVTVFDRSGKELKTEEGQFTPPNSITIGKSSEFLLNPSSKSVTLPDGTYIFDWKSPSILNLTPTTTNGR